MKITFELDGDDSREEAQMLFMAKELYLSLHEIDEKCRWRLKSMPLSDEESEFLENIRDFCRPLLLLD